MGPFQPIFLLRFAGRPWQLALWLVIVMRLGLGLAGVLSAHLMPVTRAGGDFDNLIMPGTGGGTLALSIWQRYDALWYQQIAQYGYHAGDNTPHFPPTFPLLSRIVSLPLLGQIVPAELAVSSACFALAVWLLYRVARLDVGPLTARLAMLLTVSFPVGFFLVAPYTEGLYLALTLAAFLWAREDRAWAAGAAGFAATLTRTVGIFMVLPLAFEYVRQCRLRGRRPGIDVLAPALPAAGLLAMSAYIRFVAREHRSMFALGSHFGDHLTRPAQVLSDSWAHIVATGDPMEILNLVSLFAFCIVALAALSRLPLVYGVYSIPYLAFFFFRESEVSPLESVTRYLLVLFPCFIMLAVWLVRRPYLAGAWLLAGMCFQIYLFQAFIHQTFVA